METLEIKSAHDLTARATDARKPGSHSYRLNCRQFLNMQRDWQRKKDEQDGALMLMTLNLDRIWIRPDEAKQIESAILAKKSPLELD